MLWLCLWSVSWHVAAFFFFNDTATTEIYTLSLHDALPISFGAVVYSVINIKLGEHIVALCSPNLIDRKSGSAGMPRPISYAVFCLKKKNRRCDGLVAALRCRLRIVAGDASQ